MLLFYPKHLKQFSPESNLTTALVPQAQIDSPERTNLSSQINHQEQIKFGERSPAKIISAFRAPSRNITSQTLFGHVLLFSSCSKN